MFFIEPYLPLFIVLGSGVCKFMIKNEYKFGLFTTHKNVSKLKLLYRVDFLEKNQQLYALFPLMKK